MTAIRSKGRRPGETANDAVTATVAEQASTVANRLLLGARDAAVLCNVSLRTWRAWDAAGKIPHAIRIGRSTFWRPEDLQVWVAAGCPERTAWETMRKS